MSDDAKLGELMTVDEAAELRGVTRASLWDLIRRGKLRRVDRFGRTLVYRREVVDYRPGSAGRPRKDKQQ